jgi:hypothetical protein
VNADEVWSLHHRDQLVAKLHVSGSDFPWLHGDVEPCDGFEDVAPLFEEELGLLDAIKDVETPEWTAAYERIRAETRLTDPEGRDVAEYLLHINEEQAWWRWSDEPFPDERP